MLWGTNIPISSQICYTSGPAMSLCRYLGLFPLNIYEEEAGKKDNKLFLRWSPAYAFYSFAFGTISIFLTYRGFLTDVFLGREKSIRMRTTADIYVSFTDISAVVLVHFFGIFVTTFKYFTFSKYVQCFNKIDAIIPQRNLNSARNLSIFMMSFLLIGIFVTLVTDMIMYLKTAGKRTGSSVILECYTPFYVTYHVLFAYQFLYWHLVYCILRRLKLLNNYLRKWKVRFISQKAFNIVAIPVKANVNEEAQLNFRKEDKETTNRENFVLKLMMVYETLCDAVEYLNKLVGVNTAITLIGILWHLVLTPYFLIMAISRDNKEDTFTIMQVVWTVIHFGRLLLIAQPCYCCLFEVETTKELVCELIALPNVDDKIKSKFKKFSTLLQLRQFEFTASGLVTINRSLVTSVIAAVTIYLIILLQVANWKQKT